MAKHVGERVRAVRKRRALTQVQLAEKAGVSPDTISKVENGLHDPYPSTIQKLAEALKVEVEELTAG